MINFSIVHNTTTSLPTATCGVLALLFTATGVAGPIINFLPRFLLAGLLVYSGAGFIVENLFEGRRRMTRASFAITWVIFIINFLWEFFVKAELGSSVAPLLPGLLVVFLLGIILAAFEFIAAFMTKTPPADPIKGVEICSTALRAHARELRLGAMSSWFMAIPLSGFMFFGSATLFYQKLKVSLAAEQRKPGAEQLRYILLDCCGLTGLDPTAFNTFSKAHRLIIEENHVELIWTGMSGAIYDEFEKKGLLQKARVFGSLDVAVKWLEDQLLSEARRLKDLLLWSNSALESVHYRSTLASIFSISSSSPDRISSARMMPHATRVTLRPGEVIFDATKDVDSSLCLLFVGEIELEEHFGREVAQRTIFPGAFFNQHRCMLGHCSSAEVSGGGAGSELVLATALTDAVVLKFDRGDFDDLRHTEPQLALQLSLAMLRQADLTRRGRKRPLPAKEAAVSFTSVASGLLDAEADHRVELTDFQRERFGEIFELIDTNSSGEIDLSELSEYITSVGREIPANRLSELIRRLGCGTPPSPRPAGQCVRSLHLSSLAGGTTTATAASPKRSSTSL